jgi:hypothetical protein
VATNDRLWHVVLRKLAQERASDRLLNAFVQHMAPELLQRFKLLYGLQQVPGQPGQYTLQPLDGWEVHEQLQEGLQQDGSAREAAALAAAAADGGAGGAAGAGRAGRVEGQGSADEHPGRGEQGSTPAAVGAA